MSEPKARRIREVPAVTRAISILRVLKRSEDPLTIAALSRELNIVPSTCLHILRVLTDEGLVSFERNSKRYRLGLGLLSFSAAVLRQNPFVETVQQTLDQVADEFRVTTFAIERSSADQLTVVAVCSVIQAFSVRVIVGTTFPALASASGRCVAAHLNDTDKELQRRFKELRWQSPPSFSVWKGQVDDARVNGYGVDSGNFFRGVTIISVPIPGDRGPVTRCLAAAGLTEQLSGTRVKAIVKKLSEASRKLVHGAGGSSASEEGIDVGAGPG